MSELRSESREPVSSSSYNSLSSSSNKSLGGGGGSSEGSGCGCLVGIILLGLGIYFSSQKLGCVGNPPAAEQKPAEAAPAGE